MFRIAESPGERVIFTRSKDVIDAGASYVAGGVNSGFRAGIRPHPLVFKSAQGSRLIDVDDNEFIDYFLGMGPMLLGHSPREVVEAAKSQLDISILVAGQTHLEYEAAQIVSELVPSAQLVRFASSGSEAVQVAFRIARAATGRMKIIKFEGHYHGWFDNVLWSVAPDISLAGDALNPTLVGGTEGQEKSENLIVLPWNNIEAIEAKLKVGDVAAIIMEPIMFNTSGVLPNPGYLERVRELCDSHGTLLIFDEVITGFRVSSGGAQGYLNVMPDLTILGKAIANGFAVAAIVGKRIYMDLVGSGKVMHGGTYNTQAVSMAATLATLKSLKSGTPYEQIDLTGEALMAGLKKEFVRANVVHEVVGFPAVFNVRFDLLGATDYRSALGANRARYANFAYEMLTRGIRILPRGTWFLSSAHTDMDIDKTLSAVRDVLAAGI